MAALSLSASALAPSVRAGRVALPDYYDTLGQRFQLVKFLGVFPGSGAAPAALAGPAADAPAPRGALAGVPFVVTPDIDVAGAVTHAGNAALGCALAEADAPAVAALRARGAHLVGQTTGSDLSLAVAGAALAKNPFTHFGLSAGSAAVSTPTSAAVVTSFSNSRASASASRNASHASSSDAPAPRLGPMPLSSTSRTPTCSRGTAAA
jgi:Asp-tRNA(Asn)/Glu-tRNA(Gln) amidotransferase A subunit family amidase